MKRTFTMFLTLMFAVSLLSTGLVLGSSSSGTGQNRVVTFNDPYAYTNATVTVPNTLCNETNNSFAFTVVDEASADANYTFNVTVYDGNVTWFNGTVDIVSTADNTTIGYVNYTADTFSIGNDLNITILMSFTDNWTQADVWYGTVDIVDTANYALRVTTTELLISVLALGMVVLMVVKVLGSIKSTTKGNKK